MSAGIVIIGTSVIALLLAGYIAQRYGLPPPPPRIAGVDLGTTFSSIAVYQSVTGYVDVIPDKFGKKSIPSVVGFLKNGVIVVGNEAVAQQEMNPANTIYDAKRFIGRHFEKDDPIFKNDTEKYPFAITLDEDGFSYFEIELEEKIIKITPEEVGSIIIGYLLQMAENKTNSKISEIVLSVPAEFDSLQRNRTIAAAEMAGVAVRRVINEPTAAALSYGLHKKAGVEYIIVVDFGGGTLDISVLWLNGGVFVTQAMAGNNRLGGQDFNARVFNMLSKEIEKKQNIRLTDAEDRQQLRISVEKAKIQLSMLPEVWIRPVFQSIGGFEYLLTRKEFEEINFNLFESILDPIEAAVRESHLKPSDVDEIVLVGGSTRMNRVRTVVGTFFGKAPNYGVDPELAVVTGVAIQAGVLAGGWPLQVAAIELPINFKKIHKFKTLEEARSTQGNS